jgi:hypothetical protein
MLSSRAHTWIRLAALAVIVALAALPRAPDASRSSSGATHTPTAER